MKFKILFLMILILCACGTTPAEPISTFPYSDNTNSAKNNLTVFRFIDVGEGDATLITTPNNKLIVIDAGTKASARNKILPLLLNSTGELELIIASHFDSDHIGGIPEIMKGKDGIFNTEDDITPKMGVLDRGNVENINSTTFTDYFIITSDKRFSLNPGDEFEIDGLTFQILAENGLFMDKYEQKLEPEYENAHSLSLLITYNDITYLTSGDLPGPNFINQYEPYDLETHLIKLLDNIDVLHVGHHGSHNSTAASFTESIRPEMAIISVGENDYGHPSPVVIDNLRTVGAKIYLTEGDWIEDKISLNIINGDICLQTNGTFINTDVCGIF